MTRQDRLFRSYLSRLSFVGEKKLLESGCLARERIAFFLREAILDRFLLSRGTFRFSTDSKTQLSALSSSSIPSGTSLGPINPKSYPKPWESCFEGIRPFSSSKSQAQASRTTNSDVMNRATDFLSRGLGFEVEKRQTHATCPLGCIVCPEYTKTRKAQFSLFC